MKTKEELNALKVEVETVSKKLAELTDEELAQVCGGRAPGIITMYDFVEFGAESGIYLASALRPR